jgi:hypothetical protein
MRSPSTWASKTAGSFIRGEEVPALIRDYLSGADHLDDAIAQINRELATVHEDAHIGHSLLTGTIEKVAADVTANVGQGNLIVFAELAPAYARMLEVIVERTVSSNGRFERTYPPD